MEQRKNVAALTWCREEGQIVVTVQCPSVADGFQRHLTALSLGKSDRRPQTVAYDGSSFAARCGKGFGPPVTEVDRCWLVAKMAEARTVRELRSMSGVEG